MKRRLLRLVPIVPILAMVPGCGYSVRSGPRVAVQRGEPSVEGEVTLAGGFSDLRPPLLLAVPLTLAAGARTGDGAAVVRLESGAEWSAFGKDGVWGYRASGRVGGVLAGPGGAYVGARGGPALAPFGFGFPIFSLEALVNVDTGGEHGGYPMLGGVLSVGLDSYGSLRVPSGRPLRDEEGRVVATEIVWGPAFPRPSWCADLDPTEAGALGEAWLADARMEHASIAAFERLASELAALGAPAPLVAACRRAARDEARHARDAFALASAYFGRVVRARASASPYAAPRVHASFTVLAREAFLEGVIGEGVAATVLRERARMAKAEVVRAVLRRTARDEARHAALGLAILVYCLRVDPRVRSTFAQIELPIFPGDDESTATAVIWSAVRRLERVLAATGDGATARGGRRRRFVLHPSEWCAFVG